MTYQTCGCTPGTEANGWHEARCPECLEVERQQWHRAMAMVPQIVARLRSQAVAS